MTKSDIDRSPTYDPLGLQALELPTSPQTGFCIGGVPGALRREDVATLLLPPNYTNPTGRLMP